MHEYKWVATKFFVCFSVSQICMFVFTPYCFLEITVLRGSKWTMNCNYIPITDKMIVIEFIVFLCSFTFYVILCFTLHVTCYNTRDKRSLRMLSCNKCFWILSDQTHIWKEWQYVSNLNIVKTESNISLALFCVVCCDS